MLGCLFSLDLPEERRDELMQRVGDVEEQLDEIVLIWNRLGDARIAQIEALRDGFDVRETISESSYRIGTGEYPELDEIYSRERAAEKAVRLDYKSLFVFADILLGGYVHVSEGVWDGPEGINHRDGLSRFLATVTKMRADGDLPEPFGGYMAVLYDKLVALDNLLGFYRDKFITHLPPDLFMAGSGGAIAVPLEFHVEHGHRREVTEAELRTLRTTLRQVERSEGLDLGSDEPDPRPKLRKFSVLLGRMKNEQSVRTIKNLLKEWGMTSPAALEVARQLNEVLELWATIFIDKVGLVDGK